MFNEKCGSSFKIFFPWLDWSITTDTHLNGLCLVRPLSLLASLCRCMPNACRITDKELERDSNARNCLLEYQCAGPEPKALRDGFFNMQLIFLFFYFFYHEWLVLPGQVFSWLGSVRSPACQVRAKTLWLSWKEGCVVEESCTKKRKEGTSQKGRRAMNAFDLLFQ